jgi:hypothetical protein
MTPPPAAAAAQLSADVERRLEALVLEYFSERDVKEAVDCVDEFKLTPDQMSAVVPYLINLSFSRTTAEMALTADLLVALINNKLLTSPLFLKGLREILAIMPDLLIDIPKCWDYLSDVLSPLLLTQSVTLSQLVVALQSTDSKSAAVLSLLPSLLRRCASKDMECTQRLWMNSDVSWSDLMPFTEVKNFLLEQNLEFLSEEALSTISCDASDSASSKFTHAQSELTRTGLSVERPSNVADRG